MMTTSATTPSSLSHAGASHAGPIGPGTRWLPTGSLLAAAEVGLGALLLTLASQCKLPLPHAAVCLTLQPQMALWLGARLGPRRAVSAVLLWLSLAAFGLPTLAGGGGSALFGPAFGFVASYALAAPLVGAFGKDASGRSYFVWQAAGALVLLFGLCWLRLLTGSWATAWQLGVAPFWLADASKATLAFGLHVALGRPGRR